MDKQRILALADAIEGSAPPPIEGLEFYMNEWAQARGCGTKGCIAGWALAMWAPNVWQRALAEGDMVHQYEEVTATARELLGLDEFDASRLFLPGLYGHEQWPQLRSSLVSNREAARTLRHLAESGWVDWSHAQ